MKQILSIMLLLSFYEGFSLFAQSNNTGILEIEFFNVRNDSGQFAVGVNHSSKGWPRKADVELAFDKAGSKTDNTYTVVVPDFEYGIYAISVLDDENSNFEMEMFLRFPKEGWGFSQNPPFRLSAPKFEECAFDMDSVYKKLDIHLQYMGRDNDDK